MPKPMNGMPAAAASRVSCARVGGTATPELLLLPLPLLNHLAAGVARRRARDAACCRNTSLAAEAPRRIALSEPRSRAMLRPSPRKVVLHCLRRWRGVSAIMLPHPSVVIPAMVCARSPSRSGRSVTAALSAPSPPRSSPASPMCSLERARGARSSVNYDRHARAFDDTAVPPEVRRPHTAAPPFSTPPANSWVLATRYTSAPTDRTTSSRRRSLPRRRSWQRSGSTR